jgi:hypothetical protein
MRTQQKEPLKHRPQMRGIPGPSGYFLGSRAVPFGSSKSHLFP